MRRILLLGDHTPLGQSLWLESALPRMGALDTFSRDRVPYSRGRRLWGNARYGICPFVAGILRVLL